jgi:ribosome maturation factor RimP
MARSTIGSFAIRAAVGTRGAAWFDNSTTQQDAAEVAMSALRAAVADVLADAGVDLEDLTVSAAGRRQVVRVVVDRDGGVDLDLVADVSPRVSEVLDRPELAEEVPGPFVLEVTSPGVDRPLTLPRHWRRARGRLVEIARADGTTLTGRVVASDDVAATVDVDGALVEVAFAEVTRALVQVEFTRDPANAEAESE